MARNPAQNQEMRDRRREELLSAALRLFAERGLAATRITHIAEAAGISQGLLYHYYRSKEDIYVELVRRAFGRMSAASRYLEKLPVSPREKIETALTELLRMLDGDDDFATYFMLTAQAGLSPAMPEEAARLIRRHRRTPYTVLARIMRAGQADGSLRDHDADQLALVFWTTIKGLAMHRHTFGRHFQAPEPQLLMTLFLPETTS